MTYGMKDIDQIALEAARQVNAMFDDRNKVMQARIQVVIVEAIKKALNK